MANDLRQEWIDSFETDSATNVFLDERNAAYTGDNNEDYWLRTNDGINLYFAYGKNDPLSHWARVYPKHTAIRLRGPHDGKSPGRVVQFEMRRDVFDIFTSMIGNEQVILDLVVHSPNVNLYSSGPPVDVTLKSFSFKSRKMHPESDPEPK